MANSSVVYARVDPELKKEVESILVQLGITTSSLIQMLYSQIKLTGGIPFEITLHRKPLSLEEMTKEEFDKAIQTAIEDVKAGKTVSAEEVDEYFKKKYGIE